jgi:hypothetical protein
MPHLPTNSSNTDRDLPLDASTREALGTLVAAPRDASYWQSLEERIMARVRAVEPSREWWMVFAEWRSAGMVAAGLMLALSGAAMYHEYRIDRDIRALAAGAAYWTVFDGLTDNVSIAVSVPARSDSGATVVERHLYTNEP